MLFSFVFCNFLALFLGEKVPLLRLGGGGKSIGRRPFGCLPMAVFCVVFLLRCHDFLCAYNVLVEGFVVLDGLGEGIKRNADEKRMMIIFFRLHFNYSSFFNSSISGNACFNFSGISSEVLYVATPNGLS